MDVSPKVIIIPTDLFVDLEVRSAKVLLKSFNSLHEIMTLNNFNRDVVIDTWLPQLLNGSLDITKPKVRANICSMFVIYLDTLDQFNIRNFKRLDIISNGIIVYR